MPAKLISRSATQENIIKIQVRESKKPYPIYSNLEIFNKKMVCKPWLQGVL